MGQDHRWFAAFWDWAVRHESRADRAARRAVTSRARGRVLELGVGVGGNWRYLPHGVSYAGVDPDPYMLERAQRHAREEGRNVELFEAAAESLPFADNSFDTVFTTLTLCTISDVPRALAEVRRVLKPGGEFHFWEHVRPHGHVLGPLADFVTPAWTRIGAGCHPNRDTLASLEDAGFQIVELRRHPQRPIPFVRGSAVSPAVEVANTEPRGGPAAQSER